MKEISAQINEFQTGLSAPSEEDIEVLKNYKPFQIVRVQIYGVRKPRSVKQMHLYWAACRYVAHNTDDKKWNHKDKVDFQCRVALHFVDPKGVVGVRPDGEVVFKYQSIAFRNLDHILACNYFNRAFDEVMSVKLGMDAESFITAVKQSIGVIK